MVLLQSFVPDAAGSPKKSPFLEKANSGGKSQPPALDDDSHRSSAFLHLNFLIKQQKLLAEEIERIKVWSSFLSQLVLLLLLCLVDVADGIAGAGPWFQCCQEEL